MVFRSRQPGVGVLVFVRLCIAFGSTGPWIGDLSAALLKNVARDAVHPGLHIPERIYVMFEMTFAIITLALTIGALRAQFRVQALSVLVEALWAGVTFVITGFAVFTVGLRVDLDAETPGLDFASHGESG
jgi:ammonia channel protein AmtB